MALSSGVQPEYDGDDDGGGGGVYILWISDDECEKERKLGNGFVRPSTTTTTMDKSSGFLLGAQNEKALNTNWSVIDIGG